MNYESSTNSGTHITPRISGGFTLIETLVAIAILMIAIAGPLAIANKALTSALYSKDLSVATSLAQEEIEIVKNIRDNNVNNNVGFLSGVSCASGSNCSINAEGSSFALKTCNGNCDFQLYTDPVNGYTDNSGGQKTIFSRHYSLAQQGGDSNDYQVSVVVSWNEGIVPNQLVLRSELVNGSRQ